LRRALSRLYVLKMHWCNVVSADEHTKYALLFPCWRRKTTQKDIALPPPSLNAHIHYIC
jgi:hypothetical protein